MGFTGVDTFANKVYLSMGRSARDGGWEKFFGSGLVLIAVHRFSERLIMIARANCLEHLCCSRDKRKIYQKKSSIILSCFFPLALTVYLSHAHISSTGYGKRCIDRHLL